jgi:hypothetical protein
MYTYVCTLICEEFFIFTQIVREFAEQKGLDSKAACYRIIQELRYLTNQFGDLNTAIQRSQQMLAVLDMFTATKQRAIMTLMLLENIGIGVDEIVDISKALETGRKQGWWWNMIQNQGGNNG